jgi:polyhydroxyalkanoate synthesis regulator phasin
VKPIKIKKMENLFKKFVYTGVGLVSLTKDKVQKLVDELVDEFLESTESKRKELETQLKEAVENMVKKFNFASRKEMEELEARIKELEAALSEK